MHTNWEKTFFSGIALDMWRAAMSPEQTSSEADFLMKALCLEAGSAVLDIPCGNGRHSIALAGRRCRTTGVDLSEEFIAEASDKAPASTWIEGDMREFQRDGSFDGAFCFGNSFAYLNANDAKSFFQRVAQSLKPGGYFALETGVAAESILPGLLQKRWYKLDDLYMLSENQYDARNGCLDIEYTFIRGTEVTTRPASSFVFTINELCRMQEAAGLEPLQLLGSVAGEEYRMGSPRLIMVSRR